MFPLKNLARKGLMRKPEDKPSSLLSDWDKER